jgi:hypothetical protein
MDPVLAPPSVLVTVKSTPSAPIRSMAIDVTSPSPVSAMRSGACTSTS